MDVEVIACRTTTCRHCGCGSVPGSKRYPDDDAEHDTVLHRYNKVLDELFDGQEVRIAAADVLLPTTGERDALTPSHRLALRPPARPVSGALSAHAALLRTRPHRRRSGSRNRLCHHGPGRLRTPGAGVETAIGGVIGPSAGLGVVLGRRVLS